MPSIPKSGYAIQALYDKFAFRLIQSVTVLAAVPFYTWELHVLNQPELHLVARDVWAAALVCAAWYFIWYGWGWGMTVKGRRLGMESYFHVRAAILAENERDYNQSLALAGILRRFKEALATEFPAVGTELQEGWKPFRVEHMPSASIRADMALHGSVSFITGTVRIRGAVEGLSVPNLLDTSSIVFVKNARDETLRVLIPSPRATRELLTQVLMQWVGSVPQNSHTWGVLSGFNIDDAHLLEPISHPTVIDGLDASCELPFEQRPTVKVVGEQIQEGIALAATLEVGGKKFMFLPSGLFRTLTAEVSEVIGVREVPAITATLKTA